MISIRRNIINESHIWILLRLSLGFIFLWAFLDKLFGLGFATSASNSWLSGGSPTYGFLMNATYGPFSSIYQAIAGNIIVDILFMAGLLGVGLSLITNKFVRAGCISGILMLFLMWTSMLPPKNNPFLDDHIIYILILAGIAIRSRK